MSGDFLPTVIGIVLVAIVAAFALLPLLRGTSVEPALVALWPAPEPLARRSTARVPKGAVGVAG